MYYYFFASSTTGAIGANSSTHSPSITVTTTNPDGTTTTTTEFDPNLIPAGCVVLGPYETLDANQQAVLDAPQAYLYQNGAFVSNPAYPSIQLQQAKMTQIASINAGFNATLNGGFTAKTLVGGATSPHTYPSDAVAQSNFTGIVAAFTANTSKTSTMINTIDAGWVSHTKAEFFGVFSDGDNWKEAQYVQLATPLAQVQTATTVADVQKAVWTPATY